MEKPCRFVRFVVPVRNDDTRCATGLFQVQSLWYRREVPAVLRQHVIAALDWYGEELPVPPVVKRRRDALCWFRREPERPAEPGAHEPLRRAFVLASYLRSHGVPVQTLQTPDAGRVLYEDRWQVVAVPHAATPTGWVARGRRRLVVVGR